MTTALEGVSARLLDVASGALTDVPERAFVSHGRPTWHKCCPQLTVHVSGMPFKQARRGHAEISVPQPTWVVTLARPFPQVSEDGLPAATDLNEAALALQGEIASIQAAVRTSLDSIFAGCNSVTLGQALPTGEQGGMAAWEWPITALLVAMG